MPKVEVHFYDPLEEKLNVWTHGFGFLLSVLGLFFLIGRASTFDNPLYLVSFIVFGISMILVYASSTLYHKAKDPEKRFRLRIADHAMIYLLIAGSYTPFTLITLWDSIGLTLFSVIWAFAIIGIITKLFMVGKWPHVSTAMYVLMGWLAIFAIKPIINSLDIEGLYWLLAGGIAYTVGAVLYSIKQIKFNHAIWHVFVLAGSACHWIAVYVYV
ncbi:MAG: hemolysin III family protein [Bacteroidota bacterium]